MRWRIIESSLRYSSWLITISYCCTSLNWILDSILHWNYLNFEVREASSLVRSEEEKVEICVFLIVWKWIDWHVCSFGIFRHREELGGSRAEKPGTVNNQGNTFFHEALLNGHKDFKKLIEETAFITTNNNHKSVLYLATGHCWWCIHQNNPKPWRYNVSSYLSIVKIFDSPLIIIVCYFPTTNNTIYRVIFHYPYTPKRQKCI